jgi:hypothetical protein
MLRHCERASTRGSPGATRLCYKSAGMRVGTFMSGAAAVTVVGLVGFRVLDVEQRVSALSALIGAPAPALPNVVDERAGGGVVNVPGADYEQRLSALESRVTALSAVQAAAAKPSPGQDRARQDQEILAVVARENNRMRDVQLDWHRSRWLEGRDSQLGAFAQQTGLSSDQSAGLKTSLQHEVDAMVSVLKKPELIEDPDQLASDWQAVLDATDRDAQKMLTPAQNTAWAQAREIERGVLWPWLPKKQTVAH